MVETEERREARETRESADEFTGSRPKPLAEPHCSRPAGFPSLVPLSALDRTVPL